MTILETRAEAQTTVFDAKNRRRVGVFLIAGPVMMAISATLSTLAQRAAPGATDYGVAVAAPTLTAVASLADLLSVPLMIGFLAVILLFTRVWTPRIAWTAAVASTLQLVALASVIGMELLAATLAQQGVAETAVQQGMDNVPNNISGLVMLIFFMPMELVGLIFLGVALWRTRWVPRPVPILVWLVLVVDVATPGGFEWLHIGAFVLLIAAGAVLAAKVARTGAPLPPAKEHTK